MRKHFEVTEFFGSDIQEQVSASKVIDRISALNGVLQRGGKLAVGSAELFEKSRPNLASGTPTSCHCSNRCDRSGIFRSAVAFRNNPPRGATSISESIRTRLPIKDAYTNHVTM